MNYATTLSALLSSPGDIAEQERPLFKLTFELLSDRDKHKALRLLRENLGLSTELEPNEYRQ